MFATLLGGLPTPPVGDEQVAERDALDVAIRRAVSAQEEAGLEPITDGRLQDPRFERLLARLRLGDSAGASEAIVEGWRRTTAMTDRAVKQALPGPYSAAHAIAQAEGLAAPDQDALASRLADGLHAVAVALAVAGCPLVEIEEGEAAGIGADELERRRFRDAHAGLTDGIGGIHLSLSIVAASADRAGIETVLSAPYASLAVDLIAGPDNWNLVAAVPGERGIIVGVVGNDERWEEPKEVALWAARYAASTGGRGLTRVGIGSAGSYEALRWDAALRKMRLLGEAARIAALPPGADTTRLLDPRSVDARRAAMGHDAPGHERPSRMPGSARRR